MYELSKELRDAANKTPLHEKNRELMTQSADKIDELLDYTLGCNQILVADLRKLVRYLIDLCGECVEIGDECAIARLTELKEIARKLGALK